MKLKNIFLLNIAIIFLTENPNIWKFPIQHIAIVSKTLAPIISSKVNALFFVKFSITVIEFTNIL